MTENQGGRTNDLIIASPEIPRKIDCGPKLANLRRYWRDYYVEPSRSSISSGEASEDNNSECAMTENSSKVCYCTRIEHICYGDFASEMYIYVAYIRIYILVSTNTQQLAIFSSLSMLS